MGIRSLDSTSGGVAAEGSRIAPSPNSSRLALLRKSIFALMLLPHFIHLSSGATSPGDPLTQSIAFSGQLDGYLIPCGCSSPMIGGLARRAKALQNPSRDYVIRVENGDLVAGTWRQDQLKADTIVSALALMKYDAICLGEKDFALGIEALRALQTNFKGEFLCANAVDTRGKPYFASSVALKRKVQGSMVSIIVVGVLSDALGKEVQEKDPEIRFVSAKSALAQMALNVSDPGLRVLMVHGTFDEAAELSKAFPGFGLVVYAHGPADPVNARGVGSSKLVSAGSSGKHLGIADLLGASGRPSIGKVSSVSLTPELGEESETLSLIRFYQTRIEQEGLLAQVPKSVSLEGLFAGSSACADCHPKAHTSWQESRHSKALGTLVQIGHDGDPECVSCHVVGLTKQGGFRSRADTPDLANVGCEACHGPSSKHIADPNTPPPSKGKESCATCHDSAHSPRFDYASYWKRVKH